MHERLEAEATPEIEEWRKKNPIRLWIDAKPKPAGARLKYLREELKVSRWGIYRWMNGTNLPEAARFARLLAIIRCSATAYMRWWNAMPKEQPCAVSSSTQPRS